MYINIELVKIDYKCNFQLFVCNIEGVMCFPKIATFLDGKSANELIHSLQNFEFFVTQIAERLIHQRNFISIFITNNYICGWIRNWNAYANELNRITKDSPI